MTGVVATGNRIDRDLVVPAMRAERPRIVGATSGKFSI